MLIEPRCSLAPVRARRRHWLSALANAFAVFAGLLTLIPGSHAATLLEQDHPLVGKIWDTRAGQFVDEARVLAAAKAADIVLLGETHDNPVHHAIQQRLYGNLLDTRAAGLALEPFDRSTQAALDAARSNGADALKDAAQLSRGWDWDAYRPLVAAALAAQRPVLGINASRTEVRPVIRGSLADLPAEDLTRLAIEAVWNDRRQTYLRQVIVDSHCGQIDEQLTDGLVRAQRLRDATMADALLAAPRPVTVILGRGHARQDIGVPQYLAQRAPAARVLAIALEEVDREKPTPEAYLQPRASDAPPFDYLWLTARADRPDPCAAFGK